MRLGIVITRPLRDDAKSRTRVNRMFALCRAYFESAEFRERRIEEHLQKLRASGVETRLDLTG